MNAALSLKTLHQVEEGKLEAAFNGALTTVMSDLRSRCGLSTKRKIIIELEFEPMMEKNDLENVAVTSSVKVVAPKLGSPAPVTMKVKQNGDLVFSIDGDDPDQRTFGDLREGTSPK